MPASHPTPPTASIAADAGSAAAAVVLTVPIDGTAADREFVSKVPIAFARRRQVLAIRPAGNDQVVLAMADPNDRVLVDVIGRLLRTTPSVVAATPAAIAAAINAAYQQQSGQAQIVLSTLDRQDVLKEIRSLSGREDLLDVAAKAPVIRLVNLVLFDAVQAGASDVHIQPREERLLIRLRVDGVLYDSYELPLSVQEEVISRVKVMGRMNIAEKRLAQDGRATVQVGDKTVDLRIASLPTSFGERVVIRLLDKGARLYRLDELGMDPGTLASFRRSIAAEHGLVLVTGPTGSGKSTTLYSALQGINSTEKNVLTLEDPIEYRLEGISQTQVSDKKGMTFAAGLRSVLRQDPDIIMVGEIRDRETAVMAIQSALTGHLVFSTLHTNDAASAVTRLLDLGIEPYLAASSLIAVVAQRLVRRVCPSCAYERTASAAEVAVIGLDASGRPPTLRAGNGCDVCRQTGYRGRVGVFELLGVSEPIRRLIQSRATAAETREAAVRLGMKTLRDDGVRKVLAGQTTLAEVERVTLRGSDPAEAVEDEIVQETPGI